MSIEAIMTGMILHHYKTLVDLSHNNMNEASSIEKDIVVAGIYTPYSKELFDKNYDEWQDLINSLRQGNRGVFLNMLIKGCNGLGGWMDGQEDKKKDSENSSSLLFVLYFGAES